jgi:D-alanine-D-alanine ligase
MKIIIITTENQLMKETGFGAMDACVAVESALKKRFKDVTIKSCISIKNLEEVVEQSPDLVVLASKYIELVDGKKIWLSSYFEDANIIYTGSKIETLEYDSNKVKAKELILLKGIKTAKYTVVTPENYLSHTDTTIPYPLFMKPIGAANGNGIDDDSIVYNHEDFIKQAEKLFSKYGNIIIAEEYLSGPEFTVSVAHDFEKNEYKVSPIEIIPPANKNNIRMLGEKVKKENSEKYKVVTNELLRKELQNIAISSFKTLGVRDFGRIDIKLDDKGICYFLEANLVPGMTLNTSYFPVSFQMDSGIKYFEVIDLITKNAIGRALIHKIHN